MANFALHLLLAGGVAPSGRPVRCSFSLSARCCTSCWNDLRQAGGVSQTVYHALSCWCMVSNGAGTLSIEKGALTSPSSRAPRFAC